MLFSTACGGRLTATSTAQTFTSPSYPSNYPTPAYCEWLISTDLGYKVQISFNDFQLPAATGGQCGRLVFRQKSSTNSFLDLNDIEPVANFLSCTGHNNVYVVTKIEARIQVAF